MAWSSLALIAGGAVLEYLTRKKPPRFVVPRIAGDTAFEATGRIQFEETPARQVWGTFRASGVPVGHFAGVWHQSALDYWNRQGEGKELEEAEYRTILERCNDRMRLYRFISYVFSDGSSGAISALWLDGVRAPTAASRPAGYDAFRSGDLVLDSSPAARKEPFWTLVEYDGDEPLEQQTVNGKRLTPGQSFAAWFSTGAEVDGDRLARKLDQLFAAAGRAAADSDRRSAAQCKGRGLVWALCRYLTVRTFGRAQPTFPDVPDVDVLLQMQSTEPHPVYGDLLDGNYARAAFLFLTRWMGVAESEIDAATLSQAISVCDEDFVVDAVLLNPQFTTSVPSRLLPMLTVWATLGGYHETDGWALRAYREWLQARLEKVVERFTGRQFEDVSSTERAQIVARWNSRFTGTPGDSDGVRKRYNGAGQFSSDSDPDRVLQALANAMAGSITFHNGRWYIRAGSASWRPEFILTDADFADERVVVLPDTPFDDQPSAFTASIVQNSLDDYDRAQIGPVTREEATTGIIEAQDPDPRALPAAGDVSGVPRVSGAVQDLGDLDFVTDPRHAAELLRILLYQTRPGTRTFQLRVLPGHDHQHYRIGEGAVVAVNSVSEDIMGEQVGERVRSMRCVVIDRPEILDDGNVQLTLRQQDEETFGERYGDVHDYTDVGDVLLIPPTTRQDPLNCTLGTDTGPPQSAILFAGSVTGGVGRVTGSIKVLDGNSRYVPGLRCDPNTLVITGRRGTPPGPVRVMLTVTDSATPTPNKASCIGTIYTTLPPVGGEKPYIVGNRYGGRAGTTATTDLSVRYPRQLAPEYRGIPLSAWRFVPDSNGGALPTYTTIGSLGSVSSPIPAGTAATTTPIVSGVKAVARAPGGQQREIEQKLYLTVRETPDPGSCTVTYHALTLRRNERHARYVVLRDLDFSGATPPGDTVLSIPATKLNGDVNALPEGVALDDDGFVAAGTPTAAAGTYSTDVVATKGGISCRGVLTIEITEVIDPPLTASCTVAGGVEGQIGDAVARIWELDQSTPATFDVELANFTGSVTVTESIDPGFMEVVRSGDKWQVQFSGGRPVGSATFRVAARDTDGAEAFCGGVLSIEEDDDPVTPDTLNATDINVKVGEPFVGGATVRSDKTVSSFEFLDVLEEVVRGLSINPSTGDYQGTAPDDPIETTGTVRCNFSGGGYIDDDFDIAVTRDINPPPKTNCADFTAAVSAGEPFTARPGCDGGDGPYTDLGSGTGPLLGEVEQTAWPGVSWSIHFDLDENRAFLAEFSGRVPAGTADGDYVFTRNVEGNSGEQLALTAIISVRAVPLGLTGPGRAMRLTTGATRRTFGLLPAGGSGGPFSMDAVSGFPRGWGIQLGGSSPSKRTFAISVPARQPEMSGTLVVRLRRGSESQTFHCTYVVRKSGGGGGGDTEL